MGIAQKAAGASFSKIISSLTLPDRADLVGEYVFGVDENTSKVNLANSALPLVQVDGASTYAANSVTVKSGTGGYGFDTGITPSGTSTWLVVRKTSQFPGANVIGNTIGGKRQGFDSFGANNYFRNDQNNLGYGALRATPAAGSFYFEAGLYKYAAASELYWYSGGAQQSAVAANNGQTNLPKKIYIGSTNNDASTAATSEIAYFAVFNRTMTPAEIDAAYQSLKVFMNKLRGITI